MSFGDMKRTSSCSLFDSELLKKDSLTPCTLTRCGAEDEIGCLEHCLTSSEIFSEETEDCETETPSLSSSEELAVPKNHVSFNDAVSMRVVYYSSDEEEDDDKEDQTQKGQDEENVDSVVELKKEDNSTPVYEAVKFDPEEEAIRSQLVGCICATKRKRPNFAQMYGCGKSLSGDDDCNLSSDDEDFEFSEPARVIVACAPSESWFSF